VPLARQAIAELESLRRETPYVFAGLYGRPWSRCAAEKAWGLLRRESLDTVTLHDIRRTVGSRVYRMTKDMQLVKAVLNHKPNSITDIYVRLNYQYVAEALQAHADVLWSLKQEVPHDSATARAAVAVSLRLRSLEGGDPAPARARGMVPESDPTATS
jgi:integrase